MLQTKDFLLLEFKLLEIILWGTFGWVILEVEVSKFLFQVNPNLQLSMQHQPLTILATKFARRLLRKMEKSQLLRLSGATTTRIGHQILFDGCSPRCRQSRRSRQNRPRFRGLLIPLSSTGPILTMMACKTSMYLLKDLGRWTSEGLTVLLPLPSQPEPLALIHSAWVADPTSIPDAVPPLAA